MKLTIKVVKDKTKEVLTGIGELQDLKVYAGIPERNDAREDGQATNAEIMYLHENGSPELNIPPRPVVIPAVKSVQPKIVAGLRNAGKLALSGNAKAVLQQFYAIGLIAQNAMRKRIREGPFVPLSPATVQARARKHGRKKPSATDYRPLIDTAQLMNALGFAVKRRGRDLDAS